MSPDENLFRHAVDELIEGLDGVDLSRQQRELVVSMLETVVGMARTDSDLLDLKIADTALQEMAEAFEVFGPWRHVRKVTMFGSARTAPDDPIYVLARDLARRLASEGWMIVTGAGPGIMAAGTEGAGRDRSFGVNIRLPFEQGANAFIAQDPKLVEMRYFFTRKLMLIKESHAYVVLPGGFGTLDECFELLTLLQTGKAEPAPVVLVETPGEGFWRAWLRFVEEEVVPRGYVSPPDLGIFRIADSVDAANEEVQHYYRNYHSARWVGDLLVLRLARLPDEASLLALSEQFADILKSGRIRATKPLPPERNARDHLDLERLALRFDKMSYARLRALIDALNEF
jgi:uncharacterized protein (TIGR00730 family)